MICENSEEPNRSHTYFERVEGFCKGLDRLHVQMICRFIQNVEVGAVNENLGSNLLTTTYVRARQINGQNEVLRYVRRAEAHEHSAMHITTAWSSVQRPHGFSVLLKDSPPAAWPALL